MVMFARRFLIVPHNHARPVLMCERRLYLAKPIDRCLHACVHIRIQENGTAVVLLDPLTDQRRRCVEVALRASLE